MAVENNIIGELDKGAEEKTKKIKKPAKAPERKVALKEPAKPAEPKKEDNYFFTLVIVAVVMLAIIGIVFGYTKDKISKIKKGGTEVTKELESAVADLKQQLSDVKEKADILEKQNISSKKVVMDLFDKARRIPTKVNTVGWNIINDKALSFKVSYPKAWEMVKPLVESAPAAAEIKKEEIVYFQPIGKDDFINATTIKSDYHDFAKLALAEKADIFKDLELIDSYIFADGKMFYFINVDKEGNETPTILILTEKNIYRATFNIIDRKLDDYFEYRKNFEEIVSTFSLNINVEKAAASEKPKKN